MTNGSSSLRRRIIDQLDGESLVVSVAMVVRRLLVNDPTEVPFAEWHDAIQRSSLTDRTKAV